MPLVTVPLHNSTLVALFVNEITPVAPVRTLVPAEFLTVALTTVCSATVNDVGAVKAVVVGVRVAEYVKSPEEVTLPQLVVTLILTTPAACAGA